MLHYNVVFHWLGAYTKWPLFCLSLHVLAPLLLHFFFFDTLRHMECYQDTNSNCCEIWSQDFDLGPLLLLRYVTRLSANGSAAFIVRRAGLLWSQQDFEWRWSVPLFKCLTVLEFSFILFDLCLLITFFNFIMNYVPIVTFWIFTYHKIWILSIMFCFIWSYWIIYFLACLEVSWRVVS